MRKKIENVKPYKPDLSKLPLKEYYDTLPAAKRRVVYSPKADFLDEIAAVTGRTRDTVRSWCLGEYIPHPYVQEKLAKHFNTTPEVLFPKTAEVETV